MNSKPTISMVSVISNTSDDWITATQHTLLHQSTVPWVKDSMHHINIYTIFMVRKAQGDMEAGPKANETQFENQHQKWM